MPQRDHVENWWGLQKCRRCNPLGLEPLPRPLNLLPNCPDCDGSGWTEWAAMATEPWTEIIPGLWVGGHDYNTSPGGHKIVTAGPKSRFDVVVSAYHRDGFEPDDGVEYHRVIFPDSRLGPEVQQKAVAAARLIADRVTEGCSVLSRCQAGLNRSSLMAGLAMVILGFSGDDAVQLLRAKRSPWALCNEDYAEFISGVSVDDLTVAQ